MAHPLQTLAATANEFRRLMAAREMLFTVFRSYWKPGMSYQSFIPVIKRVRQEHPGMMDKGKFDLLSFLSFFSRDIH